MLIGRIEEIGLKRSGGDAKVALRVGGKEIPWDSVSKIGDIILVGAVGQQKAPSGGKCPSCGFQNEADSAFCGECGAKI
jgi:hypothetical protein